MTPQKYAEHAAKWAAAGADIIGGCCGISTDHIATLSTTLKAGQNVQPAKVTFASQPSI
ncbi:MAG: homocysteine S-methyltransferase family protein [Candidatus Puniceispirillum sp.]